jgi:hypothetical protein
MTRHAVALLLACTCLAATPAAHALTVHCVDTSSKLRNALASTFGGDDIEIRMKSGEYLTTGMRFAVTLYGSQHLEMSGGWSGLADTCTLRMRNAGLTDLDAAGTSQVLDVQVHDSAVAPSAYLHNFSISHGAGLNTQAGGLSVFAGAGTPELVFDRLRIIENSNLGGAGTGGGLRIFNNAAAMVLVRNSLVTGNTADINAGINVSSTHAGALTLIVNNTVTGNHATGAPTSAAGGVGVSYTDTRLGSVELRNNAIVANTAAGLPADANGSALSVGFTGINNAYGTPATGKATSIGSVIGDPGFVSASDPRLQPGSRLIDAGAQLSADDAASRDLQFRLRVLGAAADIGANESDWAVFRGGFEN